MPRAATTRRGNGARDQKDMMTLISTSAKTYNTPTSPVVGHVLITLGSDGAIGVSAGGLLPRHLRQVIKALQ
jgi:hypothetical protein